MCSRLAPRPNASAFRTDDGLTLAATWLRTVDPARARGHLHPHAAEIPARLGSSGRADGGRRHRRAGARFARPWGLARQPAGLRRHGSGRPGGAPLSLVARRRHAGAHRHRWRFDWRLACDAGRGRRSVGRRALRCCRRRSTTAGFVSTRPSRNTAPVPSSSSRAMTMGTRRGRCGSCGKPAPAFAKWSCSAAPATARRCCRAMSISAAACWSGSDKRCYDREPFAPEDLQCQESQ